MIRVNPFPLKRERDLRYGTQLIAQVTRRRE